MALVETLERIFNFDPDFFETIQRSLIYADAMRGTRLGDRPQFSQLSAYLRKLRRKETPNSVTRVKNQRYPPSAPLQDLQPVLLVNLTLDRPTKGYYLKLRIASAAIQCNGITTIVEDEESNFCLLFLDHQYDSDDACTILPEQGMVLVKEPLYTFTYEGMRCVRVDQPSDMIHLLDGDPRVPLKWRKQARPAAVYNSAGIRATKEWEYCKALRLFDTALRLETSPAGKLSIRHNRTVPLIQLHCHSAVLEEARYLHQYGDIKESALLRAVEAAYAIQQYDTCQHFLKILRQKFPTSRHEHVTWVCKICDRLRERLHGKYDFSHIWNHSPTSESPSLFLDIASHVGPIEPRTTPSRGRGLFATRSIKAGELLLCEKALSAIMPVSYQRRAGCFVVSQHETTLTTDLAAFGIRTDIIQKLLKNPTLRAHFEQLYDGGYRDEHVASSSSPDLDVLLADAITSQNSFGNHVNSREEHVASSSSPGLDVWLVDAIISKNSFGNYVNSREEHVWFVEKIYDGEPGTQRVTSNGSGLWLQMSFMNHACIPNVHGSYYGDVLIIRASRDIAADEELFINYCPFSDLTSRQQILSHWGFECDCRACIEESKPMTDQLSDREEVFKRLERITARANKSCGLFHHTEAGKHPESQNKAFIETRMRFIDEVKELVASWHVEFAKLESTFGAPPDVIPRHENSRLLLNLAQFHLKAYQWTECKDCALRALTSLGFDIDISSGTVKRWGVSCDAAVTMAALLYKAIKELREPALQQLMQVVKTLYLIVVGEDVSFEQTYWWLADEQEEGAREKTMAGNCAGKETTDLDASGKHAESRIDTKQKHPPEATETIRLDRATIDFRSYVPPPDDPADHVRDEDKPKKKKKARKKRSKKPKGTGHERGSDEIGEGRKM